MKNNRNFLIVMIIIIISFLVAISDYKGLLIDGDQIVSLLFTLLGLAMAAYTFIYSPIKDIINKKEVNKIKLSNLLNEFETNIMFVFKVAILIILFDFSNSFDFPFIKNAFDIDLWVFQITSLKATMCNFLICFLSSLSFLSLYDLFKGTFKILGFCLHEE